MIPATVLWLTTVGFAQEEVCAEVYDNAGLLSDLNAVDDRFRAFDMEGARTDLSGVHRSLLCMQETADPDGLARLARQLSLTFFFDQDENAMRRWARMSAYVAPDLPWYADLTEEHPFRDEVSSLGSPEMAGPDKALVMPKKGGIFWNGRPASGPKLPVEMPGFVQIMDKKGQLVARWWQDGSAWPEDYIEDGAPLPPAAPKWWTDPPPEPAHRVRAAMALFDTTVAVEEADIGDAVAEAEAEVAEVTEMEETAVEPAPAEETEIKIVETETTETETDTDTETTEKPKTKTQAPASTLKVAPIAKTPTKDQFTESEIEDAKKDLDTGTYVDPFADARRRAIRREVFEKTTTNEAGDAVTIRTEVMTFKRDRSDGQPITYEIYDYWSRDFPDWQGRAPIDRSEADEDFLSDWSDGRPPQNASRLPVLFISAKTAQAYCTSFGAQLPNLDLTEIGEGLDWEFRANGTTIVRLNAKGKAKEVDPIETFDDTGFRCTQAADVQY